MTKHPTLACSHHHQHLVFEKKAPPALGYYHCCSMKTSTAGFGGELIDFDAAAVVDIASENQWEEA